MNCLSINFRTADINIRKLLAFDKIQKQRIISALTSDGGECTVLCTCNRTEIYCSADINSALNILSEESGIEVTGLSPHILVYYGEKAQEHLFKLACGMDSMVIGEDEILRQVKNAYEQAKEFHSAGFLTNILFQSAISCAKRVKTETNISNTPVSIATITANEAVSFNKKSRVLVIGATGNIGSSIVKNLTAHRNISVAITVRKHGGKKIIPDIADVEIIDYSERYKVIDGFDCIISATSSPHYIITKEMVLKNITDKKKRLFIDLAVPPDIEASVDGVNGIRLIGIDHFKALAKINNNIRLSCAEQAEFIIAEELDEMRKKLLFHDFQPHIDKAVDFIDGLSSLKLIYFMRDSLDSKGLKKILETLISAERSE